MFSYVFGDGWFLTFLLLCSKLPGEGGGTRGYLSPGLPWAPLAPPTLVMTMVNDEDGDDDGDDDDDNACDDAGDDAGDDADDDEDGDMFLIASIENTHFHIFAAQNSRDCFNKDFFVFLHEE